MKTKIRYQQPETEVMEIEVKDVIMLGSPVAIDRDPYHGDANARRRDFWEEE